MTSPAPQRRMPEPAPRYAYYFPGHAPRSAEVLKNLLLFFDGIAVLTRDPLARQPAWVDALARAGGLRVLEPAEVYRPREAEAMAKFLAGLVEEPSMSAQLSRWEVPDDAEPEDHDEAEYRVLDRGRLGLDAAEGAELADAVSELLRRCLLRERGDNFVAAHDLVSLILTKAAFITAEAARTAPPGARRLKLHPATDGGAQALRPDLPRPPWWPAPASAQALGLPGTPSSAYGKAAGDAVADDLFDIGVGKRIGEKGFAEILDYRAEHRAEYDAYTKHLVDYLLAAEPQGTALAREALADRRAIELRTAHDQIAARHSDWVGSHGGFALTIISWAMAIGSLFVPGMGLAEKGIDTIKEYTVDRPRSAPGDASYAFLFGLLS